MIAHCVRNNAEIELIVTSEILEVIFRDHEYLIKDLMKKSNFKLYEIQEYVTLAFTVTEKILDFGAYRSDGTYDLSCDLICIGESAVKWSRELFDYYRKNPAYFKHVWLFL